jgi:hypothetical protein
MVFYFMGEIEVILDNQRFSMNKSNASESLEAISKALAPGVPVLFDNFTLTDIFWRTFNSQNTLFYSDGCLNKDMSFGINSQSNNNYFFVSFSGIDKTTTIINNQNKYYPRMALSSDEFGGIFSDIQRNNTGEGTKTIVVGNNIDSMYPDKVKLLKFASESIGVKIPKFYSWAGDIFGYGDKNIKEMRTFANHTATLHAITNLIKETMKTYMPNDAFYLFASKISDLSFPEDMPIEDFKNNNFVDNDDYALTFVNRQAKDTMALVNLKNSASVGEAFIRPVENKGVILSPHADYKNIITQSLSIENVQKYYTKNDG